MRLIVHPAARLELDAALAWCKATFGGPTATRLQRRFEQSGELLMREPQLGAPASGHTRKFALRKFPFTLVYRVEADAIAVLSVAHQSRKPGFWRGR
jgi:toxin ParE1/3/4